MNDALNVPEAQAPSALTPGLRCDDPLARYWLAQVALRLRREVCWLWRERAFQEAETGATRSAPLPPMVDPALAALDGLRFEADKRRFFEDDEVARHLSERIRAAETVAAPVFTSAPTSASAFASAFPCAVAPATPPSMAPATIEATADDPAQPRGSFSWVAAELGLAPVDCFVLALALLPVLDSAAGAVIACCHNDNARVTPSFALAQRLWDDPGEVFRCMLPGHVLAAYGLLVPVENLDSSWRAPLEVPALVAGALMFPGRAPAAALEAVAPLALPAAIDPAAIGRVAAALSAAVHAARIPSRRGATLIPVTGAPDAPLAGTAAGCAARAGVATVRLSASLPLTQLPGALTLAWLRGAALYLDADAFAGAFPNAVADAMGYSGTHAQSLRLPLPALPLVVFLGGASGKPAAGSGTLPVIEVAPLNHAERLACWRAVLARLAGSATAVSPDAQPNATGGPGAQAATDELPDIAPELARRFRFEAATIARVGAELASLGKPPRRDQILAAARAGLDLGTLAQTVTPRFRRADLMLPPLQSVQVDELIGAMRNLTRVHYEWGTARAWNEAGLSALFSGPPGTGKTMAAEVVAAELSLPLLRIDLSQVVNKYIGETEKNLRRLFDAADASDLVLFFDEADALFGKRSEVKDAHDRYANLEISYLLERMERFKGLAILATNRRKDLDEAFLRRLRFAIEFPMPGVEERMRIWQGALPPGVDAGDIDFAFLAQRFPLAGGHIRGIVFHACLQSAADGAPRQLGMASVLRALQREYDKLDRGSSLDQFGPYAGLVASQRSNR